MPRKNLKKMPKSSKKPQNRTILPQTTLQNSTHRLIFLIGLLIFVLYMCFPFLVPQKLKQHADSNTFTCTTQTGQAYQSNTPCNTQTETPNYPTPQPLTLEKALEFEKYTPAPANRLSKTASTTTFTLHKTEQEIDPNNTSNPHRKDFSIQFPNSWTAHTYSIPYQETYHLSGVNLILKKDDSFIVIKQQLFHGSRCNFAKDFVSVSYVEVNCDQVATANHPTQAWKIYTLPQNSANNVQATPWKQFFGVCDMSNENTDTTATCNNWTDIGEISFFATADNPETYNEFLEIIKSIEVL